MQILKHRNSVRRKPVVNGGFTLIEVLVAGGIMIILCIGTLTVFSHTSKINSGNNLRAQAQSVLQNEVEYYNSRRFVPIGSSTALNAMTETNMGTRTSADNQIFVVFVTIDNDPNTAGVQTTGDSTTTFKEIRIRAVPQTTQSGWLASLNTNVTIQRVRGN